MAVTVLGSNEKAAIPQPFLPDKITTRNENCEGRSNISKLFDTGKISQWEGKKIYTHAK